MNNNIAHNLSTVVDNIKKANLLYKQQAKLIVVSKNQSIQQIEEIIQHGVYDFAENYIQEAKEKWIFLQDKYPQVNLHFIGHLQSNKVKEALLLCNYIHTIDSIKLFLKLLQYNVDNKKFFIQIKLDTNKPSGCSEAECIEILNLSKQHNVNIIGLMAILPLNTGHTQNGVHSSAHFAYVKQLANKLNLPHLSMGMSTDYKEAIQFGATYVRVGSAIFNNE